MLKQSFLKELRKCSFLVQKLTYMHVCVHYFGEEDVYFRAAYHVALQQLERALRLPPAVAFAWRTECIARSREQATEALDMLGEVITTRPRDEQRGWSE